DRKPGLSIEKTETRRDIAYLQVVQSIGNQEPHGPTHQGQRDNLIDHGAHAGIVPAEATLGRGHWSFRVVCRHEELLQKSKQEWPGTRHRPPHSCRPHDAGMKARRGNLVSLGSDAQRTGHPYIKPPFLYD